MVFIITPLEGVLLEPLKPIKMLMLSSLEGPFPGFRFRIRKQQVTAHSRKKALNYALQHIRCLRQLTADLFLDMSDQKTPKEMIGFDPI